MRFSMVALLFGVGIASAADVRIIEQIVAKVNGEIVTRGELEHSRQQLDGELRQRNLPGDGFQKAFDERSKDLLRDQIDQLLLVQRAKDLNINVDSDVSKQLAQIQLENKIADPDKFQQWIKEQSGMSYEDFREQMKNGFLTRRVIGQDVGSKINVPRAEVEKYYNEHKSDFVRDERVFLREILISTAGKTGKDLEAAEKKAKDILERARRGDKFGDLARDNSDAESAKTYGELGSFTRGKLRKDIEDIVFSHERGYITDLIKTDNGFLILRVDEKYTAGQASLEEVYNDITEKLYMPLFQPAVREYLTKLRTNAFLEIREGYVDSGAAPGKDTHWTDPAELKPETVTKEEVANKTRRKKLLWVVPIPGTNTTAKGKSSSN